MTISSLEYLYHGYAIAIIIHVFSMVIHTYSVLRLQFKEAGVQNGLRSLRVRMLIWGLTLETISLITIFVLVARFFFTDIDVARYYMVTLVLIHSVGIFVNTLNWRHIYRDQFSDESKKLHREIQKIEDGV